MSGQAIHSGLPFPGRGKTSAEMRANSEWMRERVRSEWAAGGGPVYLPAGEYYLSGNPLLLEALGQEVKAT